MHCSCCAPRSVSAASSPVPDGTGSADSRTTLDNAKQSTWMNGSILRAATACVCSSRVVPLLLATVTLGCATSLRAYPGPARPVRDIGVVAPGIEGGIAQQRYVALLKVDDKDRLYDWSGGAATPVHLLPGTHRFRVECKQSTGSGLGLAALAADAYANARDQEASISFPVRSGFIHRIHYDHDKRCFSVSWESSDNRGIEVEDLYPTVTVTREVLGPTRSPPFVPQKAKVEVLVGSLAPTEDSVPCERTADQTREYWCQAQP